MHVLEAPIWWIGQVDVETAVNVVYEVCVGNLQRAHKNSVAVSAKMVEMGPYTIPALNTIKHIYTNLKQN